MRDHMPSSQKIVRAENKTRTPARTLHEVCKPNEIMVTSGLEFVGILGSVELEDERNSELCKKHSLIIDLKRNTGLHFSLD
jgi:hypothetical protein